MIKKSISQRDLQSIWHPFTPQLNMQPPIALVGGHPWVPLAQQIAELEKTAITQALTVTQGNKSAAAQRLGISRAKLYERLTSLHLV